MGKQKAHPGQPGIVRTNIEASRFLAARAAEQGGVAPLARRLMRPEQRIQRLIDRVGVREANAADGLAILRALGFQGITGLEPRELPCIGLPSQPPPPQAA